MYNIFRAISITLLLSIFNHIPLLIYSAENSLECDQTVDLTHTIRKSLVAGHIIITKEHTHLLTKKKVIKTVSFLEKEHAVHVAVSALESASLIPLTLINYTLHYAKTFKHFCYIPQPTPPTTIETMHQIHIHKAWDVQGIINDYNLIPSQKELLIKDEMEFIKHYEIIQAKKLLVDLLHYFLCSINKTHQSPSLEANSIKLEHLLAQYTLHERYYGSDTIETFQNALIPAFLEGTLPLHDLYENFKPYFTTPKIEKINLCNNEKEIKEKTLSYYQTLCNSKNRKTLSTHKEIFPPFIFLTVKKDKRV